MSPARPALVLLAGWTALAVAASVWPEPLLPLWIGGGALLALAALVDAAILHMRTPCTVERDVAPALALGTSNRIALTLRNPGRLALRLRVHDHAPASFAVSGMPCDVALAADAALRVEYRAQPCERGELEFEPADLSIGSPLRLWKRRARAGVAQSVRVYPNFQRVQEYARLALDRRTEQMGIHQRPRRGEGLEFHQLREYRPGDPLRQIDWKATARISKAISREYQEERDQQIVLLLDCGRRMHTRDGELAHFDHALDAVLLLAHVALKHGDGVGVLSAGAQERWVAPRKGLAHHRTLMNAVYDLRTTDHATDYLALATALVARIRKRALVILVTNVRDEDQQELAQAMQLLGRRHLVLAASLRERALGEALEQPVETEAAAVLSAATHLYLESRRAAHAQLRAIGLHLIDAEPSQLAVALVNGYLDIKRRALL
jgi:uncharacterized protein (DUF58 family)